MASDAALPPGKPAGVLPAQNLKDTELLLFGVALLAAIGIGVIVQAKANTSTTSTTTSP